MMARLSLRARLLCARLSHCTYDRNSSCRSSFSTSLNDIVRNFNNTMNPNDAQRREDQTRQEDQASRPDGRSEEEQHRYGDARSPHAINITVAVAVEVVR